MSVTIDGGQAATIFLVLLRCTGLVLAAPIFGHRTVPMLVKLGFGAALTIALAPAVSVAAHPSCSAHCATLACAPAPPV